MIIDTGLPSAECLWIPSHAALAVFLSERILDKQNSQAGWEEAGYLKFNVKQQTLKGYRTEKKKMGKCLNTVNQRWKLITGRG